MKTATVLPHWPSHGVALFEIDLSVELDEECRLVFFGCFSWNLRNCFKISKIIEWGKID